MTAVKYSRLPDDEGSSTFDYSSAFSFEDKRCVAMKYKSAFTFEKPEACRYDNGQIEPVSPSSDKAFRLLVTFGFFVIFLFTFPVMVWFSFKKAHLSERIIVFRLGRLHKSAGPGWVLVFPILDRYHKVNVKLKAFSVPPKQVITGDGSIIEVGAEIYFQIKDAEKSVRSVQNLDQSTRILVQTLLCNILSQKTLSEIEAERRAIADTLLENSNKVCGDWGVYISRVELSQIKVLSDPPAKKKPTFMMPPGLFGAGAQSQMPAAFAHLASALMTSQGDDQAQSITDTFQAFTQLAQITPVEQLNPASTVVNSLTQLPQKHGSTTPHLGLDTQANNTMTDAGKPQCFGQCYGTTLWLSTPKQTPEEILASIREALCPELVNKVRASYQFEITGPDGGVYHLNLETGSGGINEGPDPSNSPAATLTLTFDDLQAMLVGKLKPYQAYMSGRLRVIGDMSTALKLDELGKRIQVNKSLKENGVVNV